MQEKTLFEEIRNGNIEMFGILFKKYFGSMCVIAKSFISDTQAAEDIVQDIFIRLWEKRREYEEIPNLQVFLYVLVKNRCMDFLRSKKNTIEYTETELIYQAETFQDLVQEEEICRIMLSPVLPSLPVSSLSVSMVMQVFLGSLHLRIACKAVYAQTLSS